MFDPTGTWPDGRSALTSPRAPCSGSASRGTRRPARAAPALPDRRARRGQRRQDRRLPPHRARADRRRPGRRARAAEPAVRRGAALPARRARRAAPGAAGPPVPRAVRAAGADAPGRRRGRARRPAVDLRGAQRPRQPAGTGPAGARAAPRGRGRGGDRAQPGLDGRRLAIFKAGGVYLPIEPHFPADRIATMLSRAECKLVLTEPGSTATLDQALDTLPGVQMLIVDAAYAGRPCRRRSRRRRGGRSARLHLLHVRLHRRAQGRDVRARGHAQPPLRQDR